MSADSGNVGTVEEDEDDFDTEASTDNVGEVSVEINIEDLMSEMEASGLPAPPLTGHSARKRLEELMEERRVWRELMDMDEFDLDE